MASTTSTNVRVSDGLSTGQLAPAPAWQPSLRIVVAYAVAAALWIAFSDQLVEALVSEPEAITRLQTIKGWGFVLLSSTALFFLIKRTIHVLQDVSAERAAADEVLRSIFENSPLGIVLVDEGGHYVRVNKTFAELLGYPQDSLIGMHFRDVTVSEDEKPSAQVYEDLREGAERPVTLEKRYVRADGSTMWAHLTASLLGSEAPGYAVAIIKDITARKERERELQRTVAALTASDQQRKRLLDALLTAEEAERQRIAADIHDDTLQVMTSALLTLDLAGRGDVSEERQGKLLRTARDQLYSAMKRLRRLVFDLRPVLLEREGLVPALERILTEAASDRPGFSYAVEDRSDADIPAEIAMVAYRIGREAITNALKHSQAVHVDVLVRGQRDRLTVTVRDNGGGFNLDAQSEDGSEHMGLRLMRERAESVDGKFAIHSTPGVGTDVIFEVPLVPLLPESQLRLDAVMEQEVG